tara:strand:- start:625 stop:1407 length:783 start_codon:yes stop_codon:yes gene_type:complete
MKQIIKHFGVIILLFILGCSPNPDSLKMEMIDEETISPVTNQEKKETIERKLIKEGNVSFETKNVNETRKNIFEAVNKFKGYISSDQEYKSSDRKSNTVIIRIPADNFDNLLNDATQGIEKFDSKDIKVKDVTEEFLDIQARVKTKKELELRYIELLKKAKNVTEILEIEKQIGQLRSEIESIEGRLTYLKARVSFSTLTMTFYERIPNQTEFGQKFKQAFSNGWDNLIWFFVAIANIWPFLLIGLLLLIGIKIYNKKIK